MEQGNAPDRLPQRRLQLQIAGIGEQVAPDGVEEGGALHVLGVEGCAELGVERLEYHTVGRAPLLGVLVVPVVKDVRDARGDP